MPGRATACGPTDSGSCLGFEADYRGFGASGGSFKADGAFEAKPVTALRVAYFLEMAPADLLNGRFAPGACPRCGHIPDFADEPTKVEDTPPERPAPVPRGGLRLVK